MDGDSVLNCALTAEWVSPQGTTLRKVNHKFATLRLIRNEFRVMFLEISHGKIAPVRLELKGISVHKKFMAEGKASIKFQTENCTVFLSNAPPSSLVLFLRTMFVKMTGEKDGASTPKSKATLREQLLSNRPKSFEEISPVTTVDIQKAKFAISKSSTTTPSPPTAKKRKAPEVSGKAPAAKKLYPTAATETVLNEEQKRILEACLGGKNIFFTGSAGTGKSFLLKKIIAALPPDTTMATASTGVAACHIGGTTLHAFAGIGGGDYSVERCYQLASKSAAAQTWRRCKHLIIDEVSMVDGAYFEKIEAVARHVRKNDKPFGGIQLILCGDFLQLPPVIKSDPSVKHKRFCFQSAAWEKCVDICYELKIVHRQKDAQFVSILNSIRIGRVTDEISDRLTATAKQRIESDGILATRLCSHTNDSQLINESKLKQLEGEEKVFNAQDTDYASAQLDSQTIAPSRLILKVGAQVMLLKNVSIASGLVNGARGVVIRFDEGLPVVRFKNQKEYVAKTERWIVKTSSGQLLARRQVPLNLAWAFSIHKSQGLTLDCVEMSLSKIFEAGQAYVALSRAQSLDTLRVLDFDSRQVWANADVLEFYQKFRRRLQQMEIMPLGRQFAPSDKRMQGLKAKLKKVKSFGGKPILTIC